VCLTLAASIVLAQNVIVEEYEEVMLMPTVTIDISDEELQRIMKEQRQIVANHLGISVEELQRRTDAGEAISIPGVTIVDGAVVNFTTPTPYYLNPYGTDEDELQRTSRVPIDPGYIIDEEQRRRQTMILQVFTEVGTTGEEMAQFAEKLEERMKLRKQLMDEYMGSIDVTADNYVEVIDVMFDDFLAPIANDIRAESFNFISDEQYATLMTRLYQLSEQGDFDMTAGPLDESLNAIIKNLWIMSDAVGLTEEQFGDLVQVHKDFVAEMMMPGRDEELLKTQLSEKESTTAKDENERIQQLFTRVRKKLDTLLTAEQKAKLSKIKADIPEYMRSALVGMKPDGTNDNAEEASGPWRPGANSWVPGMGAPKDLQNDPREAPRIREPRDGRRFPGSE